MSFKQCGYNQNWVVHVMSITKKKILEALIEGKFLRKSFNKIIKDLGLDRELGILTRKLFFKNKKIVPNRIFFNTFQGDYTCNPKYITEELLRQNINCEIIWGVRIAQLKKINELPSNIKFVNRYTYQFYEYMATSKIIIMNSVEIFKNPIDKKRGQYLFQTWHGSLGIKRFDKGVNSGKAWVKAAELVSKITDFCISNSDFENNVLRTSYWDKSHILLYGHPRNDILINSVCKKNIISEKIRKKYELEYGYKYVLYAPTFRDAKNFDCYNIDYDTLVKTLKDKFGGEWKVLVRFHPTVRSLSAGVLDQNNNVIDVTNYPDIQEIMVFVDVAITDYSSWIYDFILTKKPGFIFATDIELYNTERGFYYPLESTPFPLARNNGELMNNIFSFNNITYQKKIVEFLKDKGCVEDGKASYRVVEKIKEIIGE